MRLRIVPNSLTNFLYLASIVSAFFVLIKSGLNSIQYKRDVISLLLFLVHYVFSAMVYAMGDVPGFSWLQKDFAYALLPILFYIFVRLSKFKFDYNILLILTLVVAIIFDILALFILFSPSSFIVRMFVWDMIESHSVAYALYGILGSIMGGFVNVIALSICIFAPIKLRNVYLILLSVFFVLCTFMVGQRTPIVGVALIAIIAFLNKKGKNRIILFLSLALLIIVFFNVNIKIEGFSLREAMTERYSQRFSVMTSGAESRGNQRQILNDNNIFSVIFGEGVGKYSPENPYSKHPMPDAMMYRIFNEMGFVGLLLYLNFFFVNIRMAIKKRNMFMVVLVTYSFIAHYFNRVLFTAPISIIPYILIACFNWKYSFSETEVKKYENI